jgi:hypothetical protein
MGNPVSVRLFGEIRCQFVFSGKNDELTPETVLSRIVAIPHPRYGDDSGEGSVGIKVLH